MAYLISKRVMALFFVVLITTGVSQTPRSGNAGSGKAVNPVNFSIKGLRLHMTADEARPIMEQLAGENASSVQDWQDRCASEKVSALRAHQKIAHDGYSHGSCLTYLEYSPRGTSAVRSEFTVHLDFTEDLPKSPGTVRVWHIHLEQNDLKTEADKKSFFSAIIEKYGSPTAATPLEVSYCSERGPEKTCRVNVSYDRTSENLVCDTFGVDLGCRFSPRLGRVGFFVRANADRIIVDLYDAAFATQSAYEQAKMIGDTRTTQKPSL